MAERGRQAGGPVPLGPLARPGGDREQALPSHRVFGVETIMNVPAEMEKGQQRLDIQAA